MSRAEDYYRKAVLSSLEQGPKQRKELVGELTPTVDHPIAKMSVKKLQETLNVLEDEQRIIRRQEQIRGSHRLASVYALPQDESLVKTRKDGVSDATCRKTGRKPTTLEGRVKHVVEHLRLTLMRDPTLLEIGLKIGQPPKEIEAIAFRLSPETGWKEPSEKQCSLAEAKVKDVYELAGLFNHFGNKLVLSRPFSPLVRDPVDEVSRRINYALRYEKDQLPEIVVVNEEEQKIEFEFRWPKSSKWYLSMDYTEYYYKDSGKLSGKLAPDCDRLKKNMDELRKKK